MSAHGMLFEFSTADDLIAAARRARQAGYLHAEAYSPFPVEGLADALGFSRNRVPLATLLGGIVGGAATYFLQWYTAVHDYPVNVGGRPLHSWPSFIPATFEITVLGAAIAAVISMLKMNGLPRLRHPLFEVPEFDLATRNRFFLFLPAADGVYDADHARRIMSDLSPLLVREVSA
ncbi:quinol:cytochrome c oxidoreductase membrane protein [Paucimonas lemoignei]|uniref:Quinol:cytochrome c oxidoreductase membrane protein n=1 Tax=Paucimonas lemoignei TaxID=29443 RepID=A0A4R3I2B5_PAULE|nr:DUF3341 domain-containing protein [Paucimonas lemoignei]TCS39364.1 quinol:cytochrome c oxidoreductase membrane protein [Paucimonas lemoignei]